MVNGKEALPRKLEVYEWKRVDREWFTQNGVRRYYSTKGQTTYPRGTMDQSQELPGLRQVRSPRVRSELESINPPVSTASNVT